MSTYRSMRRNLIPSVLATLAALTSAGSAQAASWGWTATMYAWASDMTLDVKANDRQLIDKKLDFKDVIPAVDMAFTLHLEGQKGAHGVLFDVNYVDLGNDSSERDLPAPLPGTLEINVDMSMTFFELAGTYDPGADGAGVGFLYGTRIVDANQEIVADFSSPFVADRVYDGGGTLYDAMVGARYGGAISDRWSLRLRGDIATGGTELTWSAMAGFGYTFGKTGKYTALFGYRYMDMDFKEKDARAEVETHLVMSGAIAALAIRL